MLQNGMKNINHPTLFQSLEQDNGKKIELESQRGAGAGFGVLWNFVPTNEVGKQMLAATEGFFIDFSI